jgi:catechol 2,3-dioxygenase
MYEPLISQLGHVELLTPKLEESVRFFTRVLGMEETGRDGGSIYLRCWGDFFHHSVQLTLSEAPGVGHIGWRAAGPEQLAQAAARLEASGLGEGWRGAGTGHGAAYRYRGPGGHPQEIFWEVERFAAPAQTRSAFPARPQRHATGALAPRHLDHVTVATQNPYTDSEWYRDTLAYRFMEWTALDEDHPDLCVFSMVTTNEKSHDLGLTLDLSSVRGRLHHLAFWVDTVEDVLKAADLLIEAGTPIEFGPGRHGMGEQTYLYFREPGGVRLEFDSGGYRNYQPDWEPVKWMPAQGSNTMYRNLAMPDSMMEAFPGGDAGAVPEADLAAIANPWAKGGK